MRLQPEIPLHNDIFRDGGEMGQRMGEIDWSRTPLGAPSTWPQSLKTAVQIMLGSRYAMWMGWGPEVTFLYNDAYRPTLGTKHPWALGKPSQAVWAEIWKDIGPRIEEVLRTGRATYDEDLMLILERSGYREESFHTFSYSPLRDDSGNVGGHLCVVIEETIRVINDRRLRLMRDIGTRITKTRSVGALFNEVCQCLATNERDLPFTLMYLLRADGETAELVCSTGIHSTHPAAAPEVAIHSDQSPWPIAEALGRTNPLLIDINPSRLNNLPTGAWDIPPRQAIVVPIADQAQVQPAGVMIAGLNPYLPFSDDYRGFFDLLTAQIAAGLADVRAFERERERAEALAEIDRAKTTFFSNASHEFRTPLTLMLGPLEDIIVRNPHSDTVVADRGQLELMHRNGLRLLKLVNTLLDFSRLEAGRIRAAFEPVDLAVFTADLASAFRSAMEKAGLRYVIDCKPLGAAIYVDRDMWEKIVLNLISNAFKYTFDGEIRVAQSLSKDGKHAQLSVTDTGLGIAQEEILHIFERFHRIEGQHGRTHEGTGIGLALVKELARLHGGAVDVTSAPGKGSCFTVSIPVGKAHLPADRVGSPRIPAGAAIAPEVFVEEALRWLPEQPPKPESDVSWGLLDRPQPGHFTGDRALVLVVDDNADMRDYASRLLAGNYDVETATDGAAALVALRRRRPDLVLSDVMMPRLDGFGLLREIRADPRLHDLPVILLSARAGEEASIEGLQAGADDYLIKPFSARELLARIKTNLELARERRRASLALAESERRLRAIFADANVGIAQTDLAGRYVLINRKYADIVGRSMEELRGVRLIDLTHPEDRPRYDALLENMLRTGHSFTIELRKVRPDGSAVWISDSVSLLDDPDGKPQYVVLIVQDTNARRLAEDSLKQLNETLEQRVAEEIEQRMKAQEALRQAQKMEIIGQLTGGVAHDFNNLLQVILGNLDALRRRLETSGADDKATLLRLSEAAARGGNRAAVLTQRLLAFARRQPLKPEPLDVNHLVKGMSDLLRSTVGGRIEIETILAAGLWSVSADHNQLESALLNLVVNSRDAIADTGKVTIETGNTYLDDTYAAQIEEVTPGQYVMIAVTDSGSGMSKDVVARAFDPFFTTKEIGQGTGLGLSQVYGFVRQSGGNVKIYSEPGQGTTVRLYLPRLTGTDASVTAAAAAHSMALANRHPRETILVVEDDFNVRANTAAMLRESNYAVLDAEDGRTALTLLEENPQIRLIFTDIGLPGGIDGRQLADRARSVRPDLKVLFTTGFARNAMVYKERPEPGFDLLVKPFSQEQLAGAINRLLQEIS